MARTALTVQEPTRFTEITPTANAVDAVNGNRYTNDGKIVLRVVNGSGGSLTVSVITPQLYDVDLPVPSRTYTIASGTRYIGPFPTSYNDTVDSATDQVSVDWSTGSSVTVEVVRVTAV